MLVVNEYLDIALAVNEDVMLVLRDVPFPIRIVEDVLSREEFRELSEEKRSALRDDKGIIRAGVQLIVSRRYFKIEETSTERLYDKIVNRDS